MADDDEWSQYWALPANQQPSNFGKRLDPSLAGQVEDRSNDPKDVLSLLNLYANATTDKLKDFLPQPRIPRGAWAAPGSLADQAGLNTLRQTPIGQNTQPAPGVPQSAIDNMRATSALLRGTPAIPWSGEIERQRQANMQQAQADQLRQVMKDLFSD